jgi:hypothetical protein
VKVTGRPAPATGTQARSWWRWWHTLPPWLLGLLAIIAAAVLLAFAVGQPALAWPR